MKAKAAHLGSTLERMAAACGPGSACVHSDPRTERGVVLSGRREREGLGRNRNGLTVTPVSDDRGTVADADEPGASVSVHHGLFRLEETGGAELQLQEFRAGDRVETERVHVGKVSARLSHVLRGRSCRRARPEPNWEAIGALVVLGLVVFGARRNREKTQWRQEAQDSARRRTRTHGRPRSASVSRRSRCRRRRSQEGSRPRSARAPTTSTRTRRRPKRTRNDATQPRSAGLLL